MDGKPRTIELRLLDSLRFMQSSLDSLVRNLVGVNDLRCDCGLDAELEYIDESYIARGMCKASQVTQCTVCESYKIFAVVVSPVDRNPPSIIANVKFQKVHT